MIDSAKFSTRCFNRQTTTDFGTDDTGSLEDEIRRCLRHAVRQRAPRNRFERFVTRHLQGDALPMDGAPDSDLMEELTDRCRVRLRSKRECGPDSAVHTASSKPAPS